MSDLIPWIAAVAQPEDAPELSHLCDGEPAEESENRATQIDRDADLRSYRGRTGAMLRLYLRYSLETGRLPSLMGSEYFRTRVTCYTVVTFEDRVVFVHDMEVCLKKLCEFSQKVILRYVFQGHNQWDTARLLGCSERTIRKCIPVAIDELSQILLDVGLLEKRESNYEKSCQGGKSDEFSASDCDDEK